MFWKRPRREERRQKVLDELLALDPPARRDRIDEAIAVGDVHPEEVDSALRLVDRLEALRVFTIRPNGDNPVQAEPAGEGPVRRRRRIAAADGATAESKGGRAGARTRRAKPFGVTIVADSDGTRRSPAPAAMPMDALEAASRLVARDRAARKASTTPLALRRRGDRASSIDHPAAALVAPVPDAPEPAAESSGEESWPSIAWLRP